MGGVCGRVGGGMPEGSSPRAEVSMGLATPGALHHLPFIICTGMPAAARKPHRPLKSINWFEFVRLVERET